MTPRWQGMSAIVALVAGALLAVLSCASTTHAQWRHHEPAWTIDALQQFIDSAELTAQPGAIRMIDMLHDNLRAAYTAQDAQHAPTAEDADPMTRLRQALRNQQMTYRHQRERVLLEHQFIRDVQAALPAWAQDAWWEAAEARLWAWRFRSSAGELGLNEHLPRVFLVDLPAVVDALDTEDSPLTPAAREHIDAQLATYQREMLALLHEAHLSALEAAVEEAGSILEFPDADLLLYSRFALQYALNAEMLTRHPYMMRGLSIQDRAIMAIRNRLPNESVRRLFDMLLARRQFPAFFVPDPVELALIELESHAPLPNDLARRVEQFALTYRRDLTRSREALIQSAQRLETREYLDHWVTYRFRDPLVPPEAAPVRPEPTRVDEMLTTRLETVLAETDALRRLLPTEAYEALPVNIRLLLSWHTYTPRDD